MDTIQHNPTGLYNCDKTGINIVQHRHTEILRLNQASNNYTSVRSRHLYESNCTFHSSDSCISKQKYETITDEWHITWINPRVPSLVVDTERDFLPVFLHFIKHTKPTKEDPVILVLDGQYSHARKLEVITLAREIHADIICLTP